MKTKHLFWAGLLGAGLTLMTLLATALVRPAGRIKDGTEGPLFPFDSGPSWTGFIDPSGVFVIAPQWPDAGTFSQGVAAVMNPDSRHLGDRLWALAGRDGRLRTPYQFDAVDAAGFHEGRLAVQRGGWGYLDLELKMVVPPRFESAGRFGSGLAPVQTGLRRHGYIDVQGQLRIEAEYDDASEFHEGLACVRRGEEVWFITPEGEPAFARRFRDAGFFAQGLCPVQRASGDWTYVDRTGREMTGLFEAATSFSGSLAAVRKGGFWGFIDEEGRWAVAAVFTRVSAFREGLAAVQGPGQDGYIDSRGRRVVSFDSGPGRNVLGDFHQGLALVEAGLRRGYINPKGEWIISRTLVR